MANLAGSSEVDIMRRASLANVHRNCLLILQYSTKFTDDVNSANTSIKSPVNQITNQHLNISIYISHLYVPSEIGRDGRVPFVTLLTYHLDHFHNDQALHARRLRVQYLNYKKYQEMISYCLNIVSL